MGRDRIRILLLFNSMYPCAGGGRETGLYNLSRYGRGELEFHVISLRAPRGARIPFADALEFAQVYPAFSWQSVIKMRGYNRFARQWDAAGGARRIEKKALSIVRNVRPHVIMSFDAGPTAVAALKLARALDICSAMNMRTFYAAERYGSATAPNATALAALKMERQVVRDTDVLLCNGEDTFEYCRGTMGRTKPTVLVHNGVDVNLFKPSLGKPMRKQMGPADAVVFISINPIRDIKGPQDAIAALASLPANVRERIRLTFLGKGAFGPFQKQAKRLRIAHLVSYLGFVTPLELPAFLTSADVAIHPVLFSAGTTHASLETLACGLPQLSYEAASLRSTCIDGKTGLLVPKGDIKALADGMRTLAGDRDLRERLGRSARELAMQFSWPRYVEKYTEALRRCCKRGEAS